MKFLIDECLHTSLVQVAHAAGVADHVNYLSLEVQKTGSCYQYSGGTFTFVIKNGADFLALLGTEPLHPGIIVIVPNVTPILQRELFQAALDRIGLRDLSNNVVEVKYVGNRVVRSEYTLPESTL